MICVDFFCGCGGLTKGLSDAGINVVLGIDKDATAKETYQHNNDIEFWDVDLSDLELDALQKFIEPDEKLLFAGCAPCQPFSQIIQNRSAKYPEDADLISHFCDFIEYYKPDYIFSENVPQIRERQVYSKFLKRLKKLGYYYEHKVLNLSDYGVPQKRLRNVLLSSRHGKIQLPRASHKKVKNFAGRYFKYPPLEAGQSDASVPNHICSGLSDINLERIKATSPNGGSSADWPEHLLPPSRKTKEKVYTDVYGRISRGKLAPTITTRCNSYSNGRFGHPEEDRPISMREAAALQTFEDEYFFYGSVRCIARQIGNAVPPMFAKCIGEQIVDFDTSLC